jgi:uncharacterized protein (TIGR03435 family)
MRLLTSGYRVQNAQIIGGPNWLTSARFDVVAKGAENATREELFLMIQPLLVDRFKLKFHMETRVLPHYELVVANNGSKLIKGEDGRCAKALEASRPCSDIVEMTNGIAAVNIPLSTIVRALGGILEDRPVVDKTGLAGRFDIQVMWMNPSRPAQSEEERKGDEVPESMFTALQEQAGLRLKAVKGPVEVFVIDHAERPSEN